MPTRSQARALPRAGTKRYEPADREAFDAGIGCHAMSANLSDVMTLTCNGESPSPLTRAQQTMLAIKAVVAALMLSALWGLAAGSASAELALADAYKVPLVVLLSALTALPVGLVTLRLANARLGGGELVTALATSIFGGTLVLAALAPLVAIYYHTSSKAGVPLALGSVFVALATAVLLFARAVLRPVANRSRRGLVGAGLVVVVFLAALLQFAALASPIIGSGTQFDGGFDATFGR